MKILVGTAYASLVIFCAVYGFWSLSPKVFWLYIHGAIWLYLLTEVLFYETTDQQDFKNVWLPPNKASKAI